MTDIESESKIVLKLIKDILLLPITLILVLFRKKSFGDLFQPVKDLFKFIFEAKATIILIIINIIVFFSVRILLIYGIVTDSLVESYFISTTKYFLSFNIIPLIGSWFFHASFLHLFSNMLFLFILGRVVEKNLGAGKTLLIYFGAAVISTVVDNLIHIFIIPIEGYAAVGASGAISGLGAAALLLSPFYITWLAFGIPLPIIAVVVLQIYTDVTGVFDPTSDIGHIAHLGGYLSVAMIMFLLGKEDRDKMKKGFFICLATIAIIILIYFLLTKYFTINLPGT